MRRGLLFSLLFLFAAGSAWADRREYNGKSYRFVELDLSKVELKLFWKDWQGHPYTTLSSVRKSLKGKKFLFAANSGIYGKALEPLGLHVTGGHELQKLNKSHASTGNFFIDPNGVFLLTKNGARVLETREMASFKDEVLEASQSGPLLVRDGNFNPKFTEKSDNRKPFRSGVGVGKNGRVYFAISEAFGNFYELAAFFRDSLKCPDALYLDGTISALLVGEEDALEQQAPFVGIWAAWER
jgi:uncharacterized protein YigE (DUF2233 family)